MTTFLTVIITFYIIVKIAFFGLIIWLFKHPKKDDNNLTVNTFDIDMYWGKTHITGAKTSDHDCQLKFKNIN